MLKYFIHWRDTSHATEFSALFNIVIQGDWDKNSASYHVKHHLWVYEHKCFQGDDIGAQFFVTQDCGVNVFVKNLGQMVSNWL